MISYAGVLSLVFVISMARTVSFAANQKVHKIKHAQASKKSIIVPNDGSESVNFGRNGRHGFR
ncbi:hypothetical protein V6Z12_D08G301000 [Gossypium hirsutum]